MYHTWFPPGLRLKHMDDLGIVQQWNLQRWDTLLPTVLKFPRRGNTASPGHQLKSTCIWSIQGDLSPLSTNCENERLFCATASHPVFRWSGKSTVPFHKSNVRFWIAHSLSMPHRLVRKWGISQCVIGWMPKSSSEAHSPVCDVRKVILLDSKKEANDCISHSVAWKVART